MTKQDKKLIAEYMGWAEIGTEDVMSGKSSTVLVKKDMSYARFDLNDAGLCVEEMQKRDEWEKFEKFCIVKFQVNPFLAYLAWLFNAENFFTAMAKWLREGKK